MGQSDVYIRVYNTGKFTGKFAAFFESEKAKKVATNKKIDNNCFAADQSYLPKMENFLSNNQLHYSIYYEG